MQPPQRKCLPVPTAVLYLQQQHPVSPLIIHLMQITAIFDLTVLNIHAIYSECIYYICILYMHIIYAVIYDVENYNIVFIL